MTLPGNLPPINQNMAGEIHSLALGVRTAVAGFTLILAYFNLRLACQIGACKSIFADLLGGKPLPSLTQLLITLETPWTMLAIALPIMTILAAFAVRSHFKALIVMTTLMVAVFIQANITSMALCSPLMGILSQLSG